MSQPNDVAARSQLLTSAPVAKILWGLGTPTMVYYLLSYAFFAVDTMFVARLDTAALTAMGLAATIAGLSLAIPAGLGGAVSTLTSAFLGAGNQAQARQLVTHAMALAVVLAAAVALIGSSSLLVLGPNLGLAPDVGAPLRDYLQLWLLGFVLVMLTSTGHAAIRATGDTRTPVLVLSGAGALNIALDPLLIFGLGPVPAFGVQGAAIATVLSRLAATAVTLYVVARRDRMIDLGMLGGMRATWQIFLRISGPVALQLLIIALVGSAVLALALRLGTSAAAGIGVAQRIEVVVLAAIAGMAMILPVVFGQNIGAGKRERAALSAFLSIKILAGVQLGVALALAASATIIAGAFSGKPDVVRAIEVYLWLVPLSYVAHGATACTGSVFVALGRMREYMLLSVVAGVVLIASAWLGCEAGALPGLLAGLSLSRMAIGVGSFFWLRSMLVSLGIHRPVAAVQSVDA